MKKQAVWMVAVLLCAASAGACSKKTDSGVAGAGGSAGAFGAAGTFSGTGGVGASAGSSAAGAGAAGMAASSVPCGTMTCAASALPFPGLPPVCCANSASSTCGLMSSATVCEARVATNPNCGSVSVFGMTFPGCCLPDGTTCGIDAYPFMAGCLSGDQLSLIPGAMPPAPKHCDGTPIAGTAGMGAAGGSAGTGGQGASGAGGAGGRSGAGGMGGAGGGAGHAGGGGVAGQ